jgi:hypothetical protein
MPNFYLHRVALLRSARDGKREKQVNRADALVKERKDKERQLESESEREKL